MRIVGGIARFVGIAVVVFVFIAPLIWMLLASLKTNLEIIDPSKTFVFEPTLKNFRTVFEVQAFGPIIWNSVIVGIGSTLFALIIGVPAAYGVARYKVKNATAFLLMARIIPGVSLLIPWYFLFSQVQLVGTYTVLILTHIFVTMPLVVAIMASFSRAFRSNLRRPPRSPGSPACRRACA